MQNASFYVQLSYGITFLVLLTLALWVVWDVRASRKKLSSLQARKRQK